MDPYIDPVGCDVCGERGMAWAGKSAQAWLGVKFRHIDPCVCADNLARKRRELERREKAVAAAESAAGLEAAS